MTIKDLLEKRASLETEMRSITAAPKGDGGDLSAEQAAKFDSLTAENEAVEKQIARQRYLDELERRTQGEQIAGSGDGRLRLFSTDGWRPLSAAFQAHTGFISTVDVSPDGRRFVTAATDGALVEVAADRPRGSDAHGDELVGGLADVVAGLTASDGGGAWLRRHLDRLATGEGEEAA